MYVYSILNRFINGKLTRAQAFVHIHHLYKDSVPNEVVSLLDTIELLQQKLEQTEEHLLNALISINLKSTYE